MNAFLVYIVKMNVAISLSYILYLLLLRKDTFFQLKRVYFVISLLFASFFSFMVFQIPNSVFYSFFRESEVAGTVIIPQQFRMEVVSDATLTPVPIDWESIIALGVIMLYSLVVVFLLLKILLQFIYIYQLKCKSEYLQFRQYSFLQNKTIKNPFSFFKWIFINRDLHNEGELEEILIHESTHANQYHSIDTLLTQMMCIINWWNPFMWLLRKEIIINLENIADSQVLNEGIDRKGYQYHLLKLTFPETAVQISNKFNVSQLKKRIIMMNKPKSLKRSYLKLFFTVPLMASLIFANSMFAELNNLKEPLKKQQLERTVIDQPSIETKQNADDDQIYDVVDKAPTFPGGEKAMYQFLAKNIKYPVEAQTKNIQGKVICQFIIEKNGRINAIKVVKSVEPTLDNEAVRVIKAMPEWIPGKQDGKAVRVKFTLPIIFKLQGDNNKSKQLSNDKESSDNDLIVVGYAKEKSHDSNDIFDVVENPPVFPGGTGAMYQFLEQNMKYPVEAQTKNIQGRVICQFIVDKDGSINNIEIVRGVDMYLDNEAIRVIKTMPKWIPGKQDGKAVRVKFTLPIIFKLNTKRGK